MVSNLKNQPCPFCGKKKLTLHEEEVADPYFGTLFVFGMTCSECGFHQSDVEPEEDQQPVKFTFEVSDEKDLSVRVIKSSHATIKIPHMVSITPGSEAEGYVTNIEGILNRVKKVIEAAGEEDEARKKAKKQLKKLNNVMLGRDKLKIIIEDPSGNSAIISEKAVKTKL